MTSSVPHPWFALHVKSRHEKQVSTALRNKGYQEFVPLYRSRNRWADRYKDVYLPLFSGYVFCRIDPANLLPTLMTPGVIDLVRIGRTAVPLEDVEISRLQSVVASPLDFQPWPYLTLGERVRVVEGPLSGIQGILTQVKSSFRVVLSVDLLQRSVGIEIDRNWVVPCDTQRRPPQLCTGELHVGRRVG